MPGIKVYELARDLNIPSKELIDRLNALGYEVKGNFTPLDEKTVNEVKKKLLEPVSRVESQAAPSADEDGAGDKPRKRRIISARRSGEVRKIQESLGESGPLPEDQATREEMPLDMEDGTGQDAEADQAPPQVGDVAEQPAASADSTPDAAQTSAEEGLETRETLLQPPPPVEPVDETRKPSIQAPRRVEGLPLPKPVDEDSGGVRGRNRMDEGEVRKGRRAGKAIDEVPGKGGWRDMRKEKQTERVGGDEEWVRPRRNKSGDKRRKAPKLASDEPKHTFNPRQKAIRIGGLITVADLASAIGVKVPEIIRKLMGLGIMAGINDAIEGATAELIAAEYDVQVQVDIIDLEDLAKEEKIRDAELSPRPPIITIMGHVDHGKTTLLDYIRSSRVASGEAGGITQHIGAYYVKSGAGDMVFLDTPGHEAFTSLRKRGANVTDIVILIVAADDGIMPQTREAIDHAKAAGVPILVAVNKIDRPNAQPDRIKTQLMEHGLVPEEFGGETVVVPLSAKTGKGVDELLEMIHLQAEMLELKSTNEGKARGHVIESSMDRQRGPVATVLVSRGTLEVGDHFVAGSVFGRVRAMYNDQHRKIKSAGPSTPVEILGYHELPESGDLFVVLDDEKTVRTVAQMRAQHKKEEENLQKRRVHLEDFLQQTSTVEEVRYLNIVLKADTQGSLEALQASLEKEGNETTRVKVIRAGVGGITETAVNLATTSNAVVIGFNVRPEAKASELARNDGVDVKTYTVIYDLINDIHSALEGMLKPVIREEVVGQGEIKSVFSSSKAGRIAGGILNEGKLEKTHQIRLYRDNVLIHSGTLASLRRFKDDVDQIQAGQEFGCMVNNFSDIKEGDFIEAVVKTEITPTLARGGRSTG